MSFIKLEIVESDEQNPEPTDARKKSDKIDGSVFARIIENKSLFSNVSLSIDAAILATLRIDNTTLPATLAVKVPYGRRH